MYNILVIDDEKFIRDTLKESLDIFGYDVKIALDGKDGVEKFEKSPFDLVITDINMPNLDGFGVARHIRRSQRPATPIIALTGDPWLIDGKGGHFNKVLEKPFQLQLLADSVNDLVH